jgi:hypothetical protein
MSDEKKLRKCWCQVDAYGCFTPSWLEVPGLGKSGPLFVDRRNIAAVDSSVSGCEVLVMLNGARFIYEVDLSARDVFHLISDGSIPGCKHEDSKLKRDERGMSLPVSQ